MTTTPLPPLPEVGYLGDDVSYGYDANDMAEYATQARADLEAENARLKEVLTEAEARLTLLIEREQHKLLDVVARDNARAALGDDE